MGLRFSKRIKMITSISVSVGFKSQWGGMNVLASAQALGSVRLPFKSWLKFAIWPGTDIELWEDIISEIWAIKPFLLRASENSVRLTK